MEEFFTALLCDNPDSLADLFNHSFTPNHLFSNFPIGTSCFGTKPIPALNIALFHNAGRCSEYLLHNGVDPDQRDGSGNEAIHSAAACGNPALLELLFSYGCNIFSKSRNGNEALHIATSFGHLSAVEWLLNAGANIESRNANFHTPLLIASSGNSIDVIRMLHSHNADITARDDFGNSALHISLSHHKIENAEFLMRLNHPLNVVNFEGVTLPMIASEIGDLSLLEYLITQGINPKILDLKQRSILHYAIKNRQIEIILFILKEQLVDPTTVDIFEVSALHLAAASGSEFIVTEILKYDYHHLNCTKCGFSPLHIALKHGVYDVIKILCSIPGIDWKVENIYRVYFVF
jgi:ankyrin repeat protein